jgi:hypothetical protein
MKVLRKLWLLCFSVLAIVCYRSALATEADVTWCLTGNATYRIDQQPMRAYCPAVAIGAVVGAWYAPEYAGYIIGKTQQQWSRDAARLACTSNPAAQAAAVGLIAACQCHNRNAANWVMSNPGKTLSILRAFAHCTSASPVSPELLQAVADSRGPEPVAHACAVTAVEKSCAIDGKQAIGTACSCSSEGKQYSGVTQ